MSKAIEYLDILRRREPPLFQEGVRKSALTDNDIEEIEQALKYTLPAPYKEFLQSYVMPQSCVINISLCGDLSVNFDEEGDDLYTNVEMDWCNPYGDTAAEFLENAEREDLYISDAFSTLEAGFLKIAEICGYIVFLDLVTGEVVYLYHEELWEMSVVDGVDASNREEIRDYVLSRKVCRDFYDFLRIICTGEIYDESDMCFKTIEELEEEEN